MDLFDLWQSSGERLTEQIGNYLFKNTPYKEGNRLLRPGFRPHAHPWPHSQLTGLISEEGTPLLFLSFSFPVRWKGRPNKLELAARKVFSSSSHSKNCSKSTQGWKKLNFILPLHDYRELHFIREVFLLIVSFNWFLFKISKLWLKVLPQQKCTYFLSCFWRTTFVIFLAEKWLIRGDNDPFC